jgi:hypothetical protein
VAGDELRVRVDGRAGAAGGGSLVVRAAGGEEVARTPITQDADADVVVQVPLERVRTHGGEWFVELEREGRVEERAPRDGVFTLEQPASAIPDAPRRASA